MRLLLPALALVLFAQNALGDTGILNPGVKWRFKTEGPIRGQPLIAGNVVIAGSADGKLYAVDKTSGELRWSIATGGPVTSSPVAAGPMVCFVSDDQHVYAANAADGRIAWRFKMNALKPGYWSWDYYTASPVIDQGRAWVGSADGSLYVLDAMTGKLLWKYETTARIRAAPAVTENAVYLPSNNGVVYVLGKSSGKLLWTFRTDGADYDSRKFGWDRNAIYAPPIVQDSLMVVASRDGKTYAVNIHTQRQKWFITYGPTWAMSTTVAGGTVYIGWSDNNLLTAVDLQSGKEKWKFTAGSMVYTKPVVLGSEVLFGSADEKLYCLNKSDGSKKWEYPLGASVYSSPVTENGVVFVGADDGYLYAVHEKAKAIKAVYHPITNDPGLDQAFLADPRITPWLKEHGFIHLDTTGLKEFLQQRISDKVPSVIVFAYEHLPASVLGDDPEKGMLRRYLDSGGKVVWFGNVPGLYTFDSQGKPVRDETIGSRLLGVKFTRFEESGNYYGRTTQLGRNLGLRPWQLFTYANVEPEGIEPLAIDGFGRVVAWMKRYNSRPGSGFISCRTWGWYASIHREDLEQIVEIAEHELE